MKQPYSCWSKVPGSVGWDRKGSPESNLHVCDEDDIKRAVYNMEEYIEKKGGTSEPLMPRRKSHEIKNLACFDDKLIVIFMLIHLETLNLIVFLLKLI